jgi:hypothetical protein
MNLLPTITADTIQITEAIKKYFAENPNEQVYVGSFEADGNAKVRRSPDRADARPSLPV